MFQQFSEMSLLYHNFVGKCLVGCSHFVKNCGLNFRTSLAMKFRGKLLEFRSMWQNNWPWELETELGKSCLSFWSTHAVLLVCFLVSQMSWWIWLYLYPKNQQLLIHGHKGFAFWKFLFWNGTASQEIGKPVQRGPRHPFPNFPVVAPCIILLIRVL